LAIDGEHRLAVLGAQGADGDVRHRLGVETWVGERYCLDIQYRPEERQPFGQPTSRGIAALALLLEMQ
jgi:hypothetical protein